MKFWCRQLILFMSFSKLQGGIFSMSSVFINSNFDQQMKMKIFEYIEFYEVDKGKISVFILWDSLCLKGPNLE